jgi:hypothetical protein
MLYQRTTIDYRNGILALPAPPGPVDASAQLDGPSLRLAAERALDAVLEDSFPASDPPSWNPGSARPAPAAHRTNDGRTADTAADLREAGVARYGVIDVSRPASAERTVVQSLVSVAAAGGISLLVPFAVVLVGSPVAISARGVIETFAWLFNLLSG